LLLRNPGNKLPGPPATRLEGGNFTDKDVQLLKHELFESKFEGIFKVDYRTAHGAANRAGKLSGLE
jgi:hypothetical protein